MDIEAQLRNSSFYDKLESALYKVVSNRKEHYEKNEKPGIDDIDQIISSGSKRCAAISAAVGLVPGGIGLIASIPEIIALITTQMKMVYDIGVAHGKEDILTPKIVLNIITSSVGTSAISFISIRSAKILIRKNSVKAIQKLIESLGIKLSTRVIKSSVSRIVPVIGAVALARWSMYSTRRIGEVAIETFADSEE